MAHSVYVKTALILIYIKGTSAQEIVLAGIGAIDVLSLLEQTPSNDLLTSDVLTPRFASKERFHCLDNDDRQYTSWYNRHVEIRF